MARRALARVDLGAITRNCERLAGALTGGAAFGAVVKADGYGHGAVPAARAAIAGGARWLFVAGPGEAPGLAASIAGPDAPPLVVLGAISAEELPEALGAGAHVTAWTEEFLAALPAGTHVHIKLDTGMGRLGTRDPAEATRLADLARARGLVVAGLMTHFATADEPGDTFMDEQLARFLAWADPLRERFPGAVRHVANSAATLRDPATHLDLVRCGVAIYGMDPFQLDPAEHGLEPALSLRSYVAAVKAIAPGESAGYGRRFVAAEPTHTATIPIGYGDGWRRALTNNGEVLIGGERYPIVGTVSMDNITVDAGREPRIAVGDEVVLIGDGLLAEEVAYRLGTINYEVTCALTPRVLREYA